MVGEGARLRLALVSDEWHGPILTLALTLKLTLTLTLTLPYP